MEFLELVETLRAEEATADRLFKGEGMGVRKMYLKRSANYAKRLAEAAKLIANVAKGRAPSYRLQEAMTTSDFPYLFGDVLDRQVLAAYREAPTTWSNFAKRSVVRDFRAVKRFSVYGADQVLSEVKEREQYEKEAINENAPYTYAVKKYGRRLDFSFETIVNDDLDVLTDGPVRLGRAARRSEQKFVTGLYVDANGPHASMYTDGVNKLTGNPALSLAALQTGMEVMSKQVDENGEPILIEMVELTVPPALEVTALNYLNALQIELTERGGTSNSKLVSQNWMKTRFRVNVDYYIPILASTANGHTSWFLFANPDNGRPALEVGFLRGHEEPEIFMKMPNSVRVGGGGADEFDFDTDSREYKVRHIFGGSRVDPKMTVASDGKGS
jgi:hypothetical protein